MHIVGPDDEWCAEAYIDTDYSHLEATDYERVVKNHLLFRLLNEAAEK